MGEVAMKVWMRGRTALADGLCNGRHGLEVTRARDGETGLDDIDVQSFELARYPQFFVLGHGRAGALLAIAQRGVENDQPVLAHGTSSVSDGHDCPA